jgi:hypothetical protein
LWCQAPRITSPGEDYPGNAVGAVAVIDDPAACGEREYGEEDQGGEGGMPSRTSSPAGRTAADVRRAGRSVPFMVSRPCARTILRTPLLRSASWRGVAGSSTSCHFVGTASYIPGICSPVTRRGPRCRNPASARRPENRSPPAADRAAQRARDAHGNGPGGHRHHERPAAARPLFGLMATWMCVDAGIIFTGALAQFGIQARTEPVRVTICDANGQARASYEPIPAGTPTARSTAMPWSPCRASAGSPTRPSSSSREVPRSRLARLPLIAPMPVGDRLGTEPFPVLRADHAVIYQGLPRRSPGTVAPPVDLRSAGGLPARHGQPGRQRF